MDDDLAEQARRIQERRRRSAREAAFRRPRAKAGGFPRTLPRIKAWYRADLGFSGSRWADSSGNGNDLTVKATYKQASTTSTINGRAALTFDSLNSTNNADVCFYDCMIEGVTDHRNLYAAWVGRKNASPASDFARMVTFLADDGDLNDWNDTASLVAIMGHPAGFTNQSTVYWASAPRIQTALTDGTDYRVIINVVDGLISQYVNGVSAADGTFNASTLNFGESNDRISIGTGYAWHDPGTSDMLSGVTGEIIFGNAALSAQNLTDLDAYLASQWGMS